MIIKDVQLFIFKENFSRDSQISDKEKTIHEEIEIGVPEQDLINDLIENRKNEISTQLKAKTFFKELDENGEEKVVVSYEIECYANFTFDDISTMDYAELNNLLFSKSKERFFEVYKENLKRVFKNAGLEEFQPKTWDLKIQK